MRHPDVPESLDGWSILHLMFRFDRRRFDACDMARRARIAEEVRALLAPLIASAESDASLAALLGHKADLMLTLYARSFDALGEAQARFDKLELMDFLAPRASYVSILEIGLYDATGKIHATLRECGLAANSVEWIAAFDAALDEQRRSPRNTGRLFAKVPQRRYVCFYPMDKKRGETVNWYALPYEERAALMNDHGKIGRSYHGQVNQVISGSIGFDDWEWGVDLYADEPIVFKKLIYEMRFDTASAKYAGFGEFYTGMQFSLDELPAYLDGARSPALHARPQPIAAN